MSRKDAQMKSSRPTKLKFLCSLGLSAVTVFGVFFVARSFFGIGSADAQAPPRPTNQRQQVATANPSTGTPQGTQANAPKISVLAVVNGEQVTRQQLAQECVRRYGAEVLETMVNKQLILSACQQRGITIPPAEIEAEINRRAEEFGLSIDRWLQMLHEERQITPQQYSRDIVWPALALRKLAANQTQVTQAEIEKVLDSELGPRVQVRLISLATQEQAEEVRARAVESPDLFQKLARDYSQDKNSASIGGLIMPIRRHLGNPVVERAAFSLREGEISPVLHVANQFIILKCVKQMESEKVTQSQLAAARQKIENHLREEKMREIAGNLFTQLQNQAQVRNVYNNKDLEQQSPGVAATINDAAITMRQLSEESIVRHGQEVLDGEINRLLLEQSLRRNGVTVTKADLDEEIARAAISYGFGIKGAPDIDGWLDHVVEQEGATVDLYVRDAVWPSVALKKLVGATVEVKNEDLEHAWDANFGERVQVRAIVLNNHRQANKVWAMARDNPTEEFFGKLAHEHSIEPVSRENFGQVPPIARHSGRPNIEKEAFALKPGEISGLVAAGDKWVILFCRGRTEPVVTNRNDPEVREELFKDIHEKKLRLAMAKTFDDLKESAQIDNFLLGTSQSGKRSNVEAGGQRVPMNARVPFGVTPNASPAPSRNSLKR